MKRRPFTILSALAPLLFGVVVVLWVTSYFPEEFYLRSYRGRVLLIFAAKPQAYRFEEPHRYLTRENALDTMRRWSEANAHGLLHWQAIGFEVALSDRTNGFWLFAVPYWAIAVPLAGFSVWGLWTAGRQGRRKTNRQCLRCGYDLRATPHRCPECGKPAEPAGVE